MTYDLKTSLDDYTEAAYADAPPSTIDVGKARADGRRRLAATRLASVGGGVAVAGVCALVVSTLGGTSPAGHDTAASPASGQTFTGTDPLSAVAKFGWLPDGLRVSDYRNGPDYGDGVTARGPMSTGKKPQIPPMLSLERFTSEPKSPSSAKKKEVPVTGSKKAYILSYPGDGGIVAAVDNLSLTWQTASGVWYTVGGDYTVHGAELEARLIKVAESMTPDDTPVPMPLHVEGLPKGVTPGTAILDSPDPAGGFNAGLTYHGPNGDAAAGYFSITVTTAGSRPDQPDPSPVSAVPTGLNPATVTMTTANPATNGVCKDSEGLHICVQDTLTEDGKDLLASVGGAKGLLKHITSLGTDRKNWTTHVVN